ncbi:fluoride efflux transporter FluC [Halorarum halobium]|uniref:fluoride efflux transporter FluC n=1 Tax=Halorarum halobium TaxID=3075121 RepID=UPI0028AC50E2|nr:CrcB family protein [Halobaculum sp. XH14]
MRGRIAALALVAAGGAVGALLRYGVDVAVGGPAGTLLVNVLGSFALGLITVALLPDRVRLFAATGLCSSFTTYSTFAVDASALGGTAGVVYVGLTYGLGVAAAAAGVTVGRWR